jgi:hypothetical protein
MARQQGVISIGRHVVVVYAGCMHSAMATCWLVALFHCPLANKMVSVLFLGPDSEYRRIQGGLYYHDGATGVQLKGFVHVECTACVITALEVCAGALRFRPVREG